MPSVRTGKSTQGEWVTSLSALKKGDIHFTQTADLIPDDRHFVTSSPRYPYPYWVDPIPDDWLAMEALVDLYDPGSTQRHHIIDIPVSMEKAGLRDFMTGNPPELGPHIRKAAKVAHHKRSAKDPRPNTAIGGLVRDLRRIVPDGDPATNDLYTNSVALAIQQGVTQSVGRARSVPRVKAKGKPRKMRANMFGVMERSASARPSICEDTPRPPSEMQAVNKFNDTLAMFLTEVEALLEKMKDPTAREVLPDIKIAHSQLDGLLTLGVDKKAPLKMFAKHMLPFAEKIQEKDVSFFLQDLPRQPWLKCSPKLGSLFAKTCQQNQDQIWEYLTYLMFLAEGVCAIPEEQLEMVDALLEKLEKDPEGGVQEMMMMLQQSAESMGDAAGPSSPKMNLWGAGPHPMDDLFGSLAQGEPAEWMGRS